MKFRVIGAMDWFTIDAPTPKIAIAFTTILGKELSLEKDGKIIKPQWAGNDWFIKEFGTSRVKFLESVEEKDLIGVAQSFQIDLPNYISELYQNDVNNFLAAWRKE